MKCFFFVAFSFWLTGVIMLSVGETYVGLLLIRKRAKMEREEM